MLEPSLDRFLRGLLGDLERRCGALCTRLAEIDDPELADHILTPYAELERLRRKAAELLADPSFGVAELRSNHLQMYTRWFELAGVLEAQALPPIERYNESDRQVTRLCRAACTEMGWSLPVPLVVGLSNQYYWTIPALGLISVPTGETTTLLGLPDLFHELGHVLLANEEAGLIGDFIQDLATYVEGERLRAERSQRPPSYMQLYEQLFGQWRDAWMREFVCDMIATYLTGPAFGWQHLRLCAGHTGQAFSPSLGETAEHPADEARFRGMLSVLRLLNLEDECAQLAELWAEYLAITRETKANEYDVCYPEDLISALAHSVVDGCRSIGLRSFQEMGQSTASISSLLNAAWIEFHRDPDGYGGWERAHLEQLWRSLASS